MPRTPKWTNKTRNMTDGILVCNFLIFVDYLFCPLPPKYKHFNCYLWLEPLKNQVWHVFAYISMHSVAEKGSVIATYMLCGRVLYRILHICLSRFVPMYIKHENAKYFCSVFFYHLEGKSMDVFVYWTKTVPEVQPETYGRQVAPVKSRYWKSIGVGKCINALDC